MSGITYVRRDRTLDQHWDESRGLDGLARVLRFVRDIDGTGDGLVRGMLAPDRIETCTPELLARTAAASAELDVPVRLHCCQSLYEFETVMPLRGSTSLGWLESGAPRAARTLPRHAARHLHEWLHPGGQPRPAPPADWRRLTSPAQASRIARPYSRGAGKPSILSGSTARPASTSVWAPTPGRPDLLHNMQVGLYAARRGRRRRGAHVDGRALQRRDAGRREGAAARRHRPPLAWRTGRHRGVRPAGPHLGPFFDPLKNLFLAGRGTDCRASYIDGRCVMEDCNVLGTDAGGCSARPIGNTGSLMASLGTGR